MGVAALAEALAEAVEDVPLDVLSWPDRTLWLVEASAPEDAARRGRALLHSEVLPGVEDLVSEAELHGLLERRSARLRRVDGGVEVGGAAWAVLSVLDAWRRADHVEVAAAALGVARHLDLPRAAARVEPGNARIVVALGPVELSDPDERADRLAGLAAPARHELAGQGVWTRPAWDPRNVELAKEVML
jgi:hypothetical protein